MLSTPPDLPAGTSAFRHRNMAHGCPSGRIADTSGVGHLFSTTFPRRDSTSATGYRRKLGMGECVMRRAKQLRSAEKRRTLWIVFWLNVAIAIGFHHRGNRRSNALIANGLDTRRTRLSILSAALTRSRVWKWSRAFSGQRLCSQCISMPSGASWRVGSDRRRW